MRMKSWHIEKAEMTETSPVKMSIQRLLAVSECALDMSRSMKPAPPNAKQKPVAIPTHQFPTIATVVYMRVLEAGC